MHSRLRFLARNMTAPLSVGLFLLAAASGLFIGCAGHAGVNPVPSDDTIVHFSYVSAAAASVCITGDFNGWSENTDCLRRTGNTWSIALHLPPGRYQYAFIIDGRTWRKDPTALLNTANGFGDENSILIVY